jgi:hypothetical protein
MSSTTLVIRLPFSAAFSGPVTSPHAPIDELAYRTKIYHSNSVNDAHFLSLQAKRQQFELPTSEKQATVTDPFGTKERVSDGGKDKMPLEVSTISRYMQKTKESL